MRCEDHVLSLDVETSGPNPEKNDLLAIGAVYAVAGKVIKRLSLKLYRNNNMDEPSVFEPNCKNKFWKDKKDLLKSFLYEGTKSKKEMYAEAIWQLFAFRAEAEAEAEKENKKLICVSDNHALDFGFLNSFITKYTNFWPLPYSTGGTFSPGICIYSRMTMLAEMMCDDIDDSPYKIVRKHYNVNKFLKKYQRKNNEKHDPVEDAERNYYNYFLTCEIAQGRVSKK